MRRFTTLSTMVGLGFAAVSQLRADDAPVVLRAGVALDGRGGILRDVSLVIERGRIVRIEPSAAAATYDLRGLTTMPGWIDTHVHITAHFGRGTGR